MPEADTTATTINILNSHHPIFHSLKWWTQRVNKTTGSILEIKHFHCVELQQLTGTIETYFLDFNRLD